MGNILLCRAGLLIRKVHAQGEKLKALKAKCMTEVKLLGAAIVNSCSLVEDQRGNLLYILLMILSCCGGSSS